MDLRELTEMCDFAATQFDNTESAFDLNTGIIHFFKDGYQLKTQVNCFWVIEDCNSYFGMDVAAELVHILLQELRLEITGVLPEYTI